MELWVCKEYFLQGLENCQCRFFARRVVHMLVPGEEGMGMHQIIASWEKDDALFREIAEYLLKRTAERMAADALHWEEEAAGEEAGGVLLQGEYP